MRKLPDIRGLSCSYSCRKNYRRRQWRPRSSPPSRCQARTRNRAVTAGAQSHGTTAACGCRRTACAPTSTPTRSSWPRWRASAHNSAGGGLLTRFGKQVRAPIRSVTHLWAGIVAHTNACIKDACSASRFSAAWPEDIRRSDTSNTIRGGGLCVKGHWVSQQLHRALRACILCFAARGSFKPSGLTSRLAKVVGAPEDELCCKSDRRVCILSGDVGATVAIAMLNARLTISKVQTRDGERAVPVWSTCALALGPPLALAGEFIQLLGRGNVPAAAPRRASSCDQAHAIALRSRS
jgi:hypothetical protein